MAEVNLLIRTRIVGDASRLLQKDADNIDALERKQTENRGKEASRRIAITRDEMDEVVKATALGEDKRTAALIDATDRRHDVEQSSQRASLVQKDTDAIVHTVTLGEDERTAALIDAAEQREQVEQSSKRLSLVEKEADAVFDATHESEKARTSLALDEAAKRESAEEDGLNRRESIVQRFRRRFLNDERSFASSLQRIQDGAMGGIAMGGRMAGRLSRDARSLMGLPTLIGSGLFGVGAGAVMKGTIGAADEVQQSSLITRMQLRGDEDAMARVQEEIRKLSSDVGVADATKGMQMGLRLTGNDIGSASELTRLAAGLGSLDPRQGVDGALHTLEDLSFGRTRRLRRNFGVQLHAEDAKKRLAAEGVTGEAADAQMGSMLLTMLNEELDRLYGGGEAGAGVSGLLDSSTHTIGGQLALIKNEIGNIAVDIGDPLVEDVVKGLKRLTDQIGELKKTPQYAAMLEGASRVIGKGANALVGVLEQIPGRVLRMYDMLNSPETQESFGRMREQASVFFELMKTAGERAFELLPKAFSVVSTAMEGAKPSLRLMRRVIERLADVAENPAVGKLLGWAGTAYVFDRATGGLVREAGGAMTRGLARGALNYGARKIGGKALGNAVASASATPVFVTNWDGMSGGLGLGNLGKGAKTAKNVARYGRGAYAATKGVLAGASATGVAATAAVGSLYAGSVLGGLYMLGRAGNPTEKDVERMKQRGKRFTERNQEENLSERQIKKRVAYYRRIGAHEQAEKLVQRTERTVNAPVQVAPTVHIQGTPSAEQMEELSAYFQGPFQQLFTRTVRKVLEDEARRNGV